MFYDELLFISEVTKIEFGNILLMQLAYEAHAACTCVVTKVNDEPIFIRTMDWEMEFLKKLTIELEFVRDGKTLFISPTWVGCVGLFTVHIPNKYSIAINYRRTKSVNFWAIAQNIYNVISMRWPVSYLVRRIAESDDSYQVALTKLKFAPLVSPCYITVFNATDKSYVITRGVDNYTMSTINDSKDIIQTNRDDNVGEQMAAEKCDDILCSKERYELATLLLSFKWNSVNELLKELLVYPIINEEHIYTCVIGKDHIRTFIE